MGRLLLNALLRYITYSEHVSLVITTSSVPKHGLSTVLYVSTSFSIYYCLTLFISITFLHIWDISIYADSCYVFSTVITIITFIIKCLVVIIIEIRYIA